ncbi:MAG: lysozyme inhibitor LprI family protein [Telluria sp.]
MPSLKLVFLSLAFAAPFASAASFNCAKASSNVEKMVCANPALSRQDDYLNDSYKRAVERLGDKLALREGQRAWLKSGALNDCKTTECVKLAYGTRVKQLDDAVKSPWNGHYVRHYKGKGDRNTAEIVLIATGDSSVTGEGSTMWLGPNAANGQVNVGEFSAVGAITGANLVFKDEECRVSARLKGRVLKVEDNNMCGGNNATFTGEYRRK